MSLSCDTYKDCGQLSDILASSLMQKWNCFHFGNFDKPNLFQFSLRKKLLAQHEILWNKLKGMLKNKAVINKRLCPCRHMFVHSRHIVYRKNVDNLNFWVFLSLFFLSWNDWKINLNNYKWYSKWVGKISIKKLWSCMWRIAHWMDEKMQIIRIP